MFKTCLTITLAYSVIASDWVILLFLKIPSPLPPLLVLLKRFFISPISLVTLFTKEFSENILASSCKFLSFNIIFLANLAAFLNIGSLSGKALAGLFKNAKDFLT